MDGENKTVHILPEKPCTERAISLVWIITFHADDNGEMSALRRSSALRSSTLLLNCEQNGAIDCCSSPEVAFVLSCV